MRRLSLNRLSDTDFEEFSFDLLDALGFVNIDWRKGTGLRSSPADKGRDIVCQELREDVDKTTHLETWLVDCKHFTKGVPAKELRNLLAWAEAERPAVALFIVSNFLSNSAKEYIETYRRNNRPAFKIKFWERPTLEKLCRGKVGVMRKHGLIGVSVRSIRAILRAEQEFFDRIWYDRKQLLYQRVREGLEVVEPSILAASRRAAREVERKYGKKNLGPYSKFEWGMINGKLSSLRWVLGEDWDMLDT